VKRREFLQTFAASLALRPLTVFAQAIAKRPLVACLVGGSKAATERYFGGFSQGMRELGYVEGRDYGSRPGTPRAIRRATRCWQKNSSVSSPTLSCQAQ
jgi:hypothetical protein